MEPLEILEFEFPARQNRLRRRAHVGVVASGNLEVLMEPSSSPNSIVRVRTNVSGYRDEWSAIFRRFFERHDVTAKIEVNDGGASPPAVQLRLEQALEEALRP